ncbi:MAG: hypothetical protein FWG02_11720, partial [Holophagaceae bacterium]|nr:hypothetical protein [Holophagaceae bacterium]
MGTDDFPKRPRRWLKRLSYVIASGAVTVSAAAWYAHSSTMQRVYIRAIASIVREMTGMDFGADSLSFSLIKGRFTLYAPYLGEGLFVADRINITTDISSFFWGVPRIRDIVVINPVSDISPEQLEKIKINKSDGVDANWIVDKLEVRNGNLFCDDPRWGRVEVFFNIKGEGKGNRKLHIDTDCHKVLVKTGMATIQNQINFELYINENILNFNKLTVVSELLNIHAAGQINVKNLVAQGYANGSIHNQYLSGSIGEAFSGISGDANFEASFFGEINNPQWTFKSIADKIITQYQPIKNCGFEIEVNGNAIDIDVKKIHIRANESQLTMQGKINESNCSLNFTGAELPLGFLSTQLKSPIFESFVADLNGTFSSSVPIWSNEVLNQHKLELTANFMKNGNSSGDLDVSVSNNFLAIKSFNINTLELMGYADGSIAFKPLLNDEGNIDFGLNSV